MSKVIWSSLLNKARDIVTNRTDEPMEDVERLLKGTVEELDRLLNAKNVLGDPIEKGAATVIPIVSYGLGFGAGGGASTKNGDGAGAGDGTKPLGAIIIDEKGARVEPVQGPIMKLAEVSGNTAGKALEKAAGTAKAKGGKA